MELYITFGILISLALFLIIYVPTQMRNERKRAISNFNLSEFEKYRIRFKQVCYPKTAAARSRGGIIVNAILYYSQDAIIISPEKDSYLNFLFGYFFPILFVSEKNKKNYYYKIPYSIYKKDNFPLRIKYETTINDVEISIIMNKNTEEEKQLVERILNWQYK